MKRFTQMLAFTLVPVLGLIGLGRSCQAADPDPILANPAPVPVARAPQVASAMVPAGMPEIHRVKI